MPLGRVSTLNLSKCPLAGSLASTGSMDRTISDMRWLYSKYKEYIKKIWVNIINNLLIDGYGP